ncbi:MAG: hypothetical protein ACRDLS_17200 [Solirubrobacteraceae bacterium]
MAAEGGAIGGASGTEGWALPDPWPSSSSPGSAGPSGPSGVRSPPSSPGVGLQLGGADSPPSPSLAVTTAGWMAVPRTTNAAAAAGRSVTPGAGSPNSRSRRHSGHPIENGSEACASPLERCLASEGIQQGLSTVSRKPDLK